MSKQFQENSNEEEIKDVWTVLVNKEIKNVRRNFLFLTLRLPNLENLDTSSSLVGVAPWSTAFQQPLQR